MLIDSNIIIYAAMPEHAALRLLIEKEVPVVSVITRVEVLGYHLLDAKTRASLEVFFDAAHVLPISDEVATQAIRLRQTRRMKLGDALIAATALVFDHAILTRNSSDFDWIPHLTVVNPFTS